MRWATTPSERAALVEASPLRGRDWVAAYTAAVDAWLADLFASTGGTNGLALVAVGGYGRSELAPGSDLDLVLLHDGRTDVAAVAEALWYPIWDAGLKLGHAVRTPREALALAADDLATATALLDVRVVAGDPSPAERLAEGALDAWRGRFGRWIGRLADSVDERHTGAGEVAFLLEPDLKLGRGGLRDVHALGWVEAAEPVLLPGDHAELAAAYDVVLAARVELHRLTGRPSDVLALQEQDGVAAALGQAEADALMASVSGAARDIAWISDETWARLRSTERAPGRFRRAAKRTPQPLLDPAADPASDPAVALEVATEAARRRIRIDRPTLDRLVAATPAFPDPWPPGAVDALVELLSTGHDAIPVIEALDRKGVWERVLPEWASVQCKPQRNAYHRFTVDRHLMEAAANAAALVDRVARPDLLLLGALLHDLGKGYPGDHTEVGIDVVGRIGTRMGLAPADVDVLVDLVRHHLLLPDVAVRRDLTDDATIERVAAAVGSVGTLQLLAALTEADSLATGTSAWGSWKAGLVAQLTARTAHLLAGGAVEELAPAEFPTPEQRRLLAAGGRHVAASDDTLVVVAPDRPGLMSRITGVLALHGLDVLTADATSDGGAALEQFRVVHGLDLDIGWDRVVADLHLALDARLALEARLAARATSHAHRYRQPAMAPTVTFDDAASATATVLEVHAADRVGVLHRITRALSDLGLDIRTAKVASLGGTVVDTFYVTGADGRPVDDPAHRAEITRAVVHALAVP